MGLMMIVAFSSKRAEAVFPPGNTNLTQTLDTWSFNGTVTWTNDLGYYPISFTNLDSSILGNGTCLVLDSTNAAWLQYNVTEASGTNNLTVDQGTITFWFAPNWTDTNNAGTGPGQFGRLIDVGSYTTNASYGWWSIYLDPAGTNIYFAAQTNNGSSAVFLSAPVSFNITNYWHMFALSYCSTGCALYLDGLFVTNGAPITIWPGSDVLSNGFYIGSDNTGIQQAHGMFDDLYTYGYPLAPETISTAFVFSSLYYYNNPMNMANIVGGRYTASTNATLEGITVVGSLIPGNPVTNCITDNIFNVWLTNLSSKLATNKTDNFTFSVAGGVNWATYDVFANALLGPTNAPAYQWAWVGQVSNCFLYTLTNLPGSYAFIRLGTPYDSDADGIPDTLENLVFHSNPNSPSTSGDGISDLYKVLHNIPLTNVVAVPSLGSISIPNCPVP
jgi:hypothetical protein